MIKPKIPRWLKIIVALYAIYLALVLIVATPLVNILAPKIYREQTGAELRIEHIVWLNPFTLSASIRQASSTLASPAQNDNAQPAAHAQATAAQLTHDQQPLWSFETLSVDLSLASVWRRHLVLDALELHGLDVHIVQTAPDRFNISDILTYRAEHFPQQPEKVEAEPSKPVAIEIDRLDVTAKQLTYRAPFAAEPMNAIVDELSFQLTNVSTLAEEKNSENSRPTGTATATIVRGNNLLANIKTLRAEFTRTQHPFTTTLHDFNLALQQFHTGKKSAYELSVRDESNGNLQIRGDFDIAQSDATGRATVRALNILPAWQFLANKLAFDMQPATLDGDATFAVNWASTNEALRYSVSDAQFALHNVRMQARNDSESRVGFESLQLKQLSVDSAQPRAQIGQVLVEKLSVAGWNKDAQVSLVDMFAFASDDKPSESPPWQLQIDEIAVKNSDIRWHASQIDHLPLSLAPFNARITQIHWPDDAPLNLDIQTSINDSAKLAATGTITSASRSGELTADVRDLPLIWGDVFVRQKMRASVTNGTLNTRTKITIDHALPVTIQSDGAVDLFELHPLDITQTTADTRKLATWKKLEWRGLALDPNKQQLNVKQIIATEPWVQFRINTDGTNNLQQLLIDSKSSSKELAATKTKSATEKKSTAANTAKTTPINAEEKPWQAVIDNIHIERAGIDFRDASLTSAFRTNITDLSGDIFRLDTRAGNAKDRAAKVALKGTVDGYAPVAITGTFNPFATQPALNITLDITNLDLATLTPYSGTYAGYKIDGGRLSVQMAYTLENNRIKGTNHIVVNQMKLGEQVRGPKVMELPLRLAIYLLTDSNGVMDLGVDVTGNVDDPDFSVGSIIWKAFRNLIVKTAASPFKALGRLVGSDRDDLDRIEFDAGSTRVAAGEHEKLPTIQRGLEQKSALRLNIMGHVSPSRDLEALRDNSLSAQLIKQGGITPADIQQQSKNWQREVVKLFKERFPNDTNALQVMQMNDAMRDNIELAPTALQDLAAERALTVKQLLVTEQALSADRVFVKPTDLGADKNPGTFATMDVE